MKFSALSASDRMAQTQRAIDERGALIDRWASLSDDQVRGWEARAMQAAELLTLASGVADMGCGTMHLKRHLRPEQTYIPVDIVSRGEGSIVCDFNKQSPPLLDVPAMACLGVLEYLHDPAAFLRATAAHYDVAVISYAATDTEKPLKNRRSHGWVNDFSAADVEALFKASGWAVDAPRVPVGTFQLLWRLHRQ